MDSSAWLHTFENYLSGAVQSLDCSAQLKEAVSYCLFPGGKRIRPLLAFSVFQDLGGSVPSAMFPAAAGVEIVHCASLIHDDLPALDNDDMRRGKPAVHRKFGEAVAVLCGDFLVPWAFSLCSQSRDDVRADVVSCLARAYMSVCDGQVIDVTEKNPPLRELHEKKTAALFECSASVAAIIARASPGVASTAAAFGRSLGLVFQAVDDVLDGVSGAQTRGRLDESLTELEDTLARFEGGTRCSLSRDIIRKTIRQLRSGTEIDVTDILGRF